MTSALLKKTPHLGEKRSKIEVEIHINHLTFNANDYFLRNSYYTVYFKGYKNTKLKSRTLIRTLDDLLKDPVGIDDKLKCSATLFQDALHNKYLDGKLKNKFRKLVVRQMTKLRSGEVLYRDVGHVLLPLHTLAQHPETIDTRLSITHPINVIDAYMDVSIKVNFDPFQSQIPMNTTRVIHKKLTHTLSSIGFVESPPKNNRHVLSQQYIHKLSPNGAFQDMLRQSQSRDSYDDENDDEISAANIRVLEKGKSDRFFLVGSFDPADDDTSPAGKDKVGSIDSGDISAEKEVVSTTEPTTPIVAEPTTPLHTATATAAE